MRRLFAWLALAVVVYGGFAVVHHRWYENNPRKILVGVDTSSQMDGSARELRAALDEIGRERYAVFSVVVDKGRRIHSWESAPQLDRTPVFYGERQLDSFVGAGRPAEMDEADLFFLVSNAKDVGDLEHAYGDFRQVVP